MKNILSSILFLSAVTCFAQSSDAELTTQANQIKNETTPGANTADRIGQMFLDIIDSKVNNSNLTWDEVLSKPTTLSGFGITDGVTNSRTITIDGVTQDLSNNRTWTTSAVDKFDNYYNVTDYGLVGDGTTDNAAAFAILVNAATAGSWLYFPTGTYMFLSSATITKKLHIVGDGTGNSIISTTASNVTLLNYDYTGDAEVADVIIRDIQIYCTAATPVSPSMGINIANSSSRLRIQNIYVGGFYTNITLINPVEYSLDRVYCASYVESGLDMRSSGLFVDAGDGSISNSYFIPSTRNAVYSIYHQNGGGLKIVNTKFNYQPSPVFQAQYHYYYEGTALTVDLNIANCSFENYSVAAIRAGVSGAGVFREVAITGNDIGDTPSAGAEGIILTGIDYVAITGNTLKSAGSGTRNAIVLTSCTNATVFNTYQGWTANVVQSGSTLITTPVLVDPAVSPSNDDFLQRKSGVWTNRTVAQVVTDLAVAPITSPTFLTGITTPLIKITGGSPGSGKVLTSDADGDATWETPSGGGGGGDFTDLSDVPSSYSGQASKIVTVKGDETGLEFTTAPTGLTLDGNISVTGTATINISDANKTIFCSGTSADYTVTLPTASGNTGKWFDFVGVDALTKVVTVDGNSAETINGLATRPFSERGGFRIVSNGTNWEVVNEKPSWITYTPTVTGTSGQPTFVTCKYSLMGKQFTLCFATSAQAASGTGFAFDLPSGYASPTAIQVWARVMTNGAYVSTGMAELTGNTINVYTTNAGGAIAATSNKAAAATLIFDLP